MKLSCLLALTAYLIFLSSPILAIPLIDGSSELAEISSPRIALRSTTHFPTPVFPPSQPRHKLKSRGIEIFFHALNYRTYFSSLNALIPISVAAPALERIYFNIHFNLTPHGAWHEKAPMSRILLRAGSMYIYFVAVDPFVPVPWELVRQWALVMEHLTDQGWFVGFYHANIERLVGERVVDFMVVAGIGDPTGSLAAGAAR